TGSTRSITRTARAATRPARRRASTGCCAAAAGTTPASIAGRPSATTGRPTRSATSSGSVSCWSTGAAERRWPATRSARDLADAVADEALERQPGGLEELADRLGLVLDEGLLGQDVLGEPGPHLALGDFLDDVGRLVLAL